jgi:ABC-2 type transport system ATP-binding protein
MSDLVIETTALRKVYRSGGRRTVAVDDLDLSVPAGGVHGFLGPNGSGKTTTIKMLLGLTRPTKGEMRLFGLQVPAQLPQVIDRVGAIVEEPHFVPTFSGRKNLSLLARSIGVPRTTVDSVLRQAGLADRAREPFATYSLGMKQRLAIAGALLKSPDLLILDEPTNGLDPAGIRGIRDLIRELGESGVTVLLNSHILAEVQQVCHSVSIVGRGRMLASGRVEDLLGEAVSRTRVGVADPQGARHFLEAAGYTVTRQGDLLEVEGHEHPEEITKLLASKGVYVTELTAVRPTLESFFLKLTGRPAPSEDAPAPPVRHVDDTIDDTPEESAATPADTDEEAT